jgi:hypothetical protein
MNYYLYKLIPPRLSFAADMTAAVVRPRQTAPS